MGGERKPKPLLESSIRRNTHSEQPSTMLCHSVERASVDRNALSTRYPCKKMIIKGGHFFQTWTCWVATHRHNDKISSSNICCFQDEAKSFGIMIIRPNLLSPSNLTLTLIFICMFFNYLLRPFLQNYSVFFR